MPLKDWNLEASELEGERKYIFKREKQNDPLNPKNDRLTQLIINSLFVDDSDPFFELSYETMAVINLIKHDEKRN